MTTKAEIINQAYSLIRISGITLEPSGEDTTLALDRLESMAAEFEGRNIKTDYNFEEQPDAGSLHNLERKYWFAYESNLAVRLLPDFGKDIPQSLLLQQQASLSFLSGDTAPFKTVKYPSRMPVGRGNTQKTFRFRRFYGETTEAPLSAETEVMYIDDIRDFVESFYEYLDSGETISSYTIESNDGLTITADANTNTAVAYTIRADGDSTEDDISLLQVKIQITTSAGRKETRIINFSLQSSKIST